MRIPQGAMWLPCTLAWHRRHVRMCMLGLSMHVYAARFSRVLSLSLSTSFMHSGNCVFRMMNRADNIEIKVTGLMGIQNFGCLILTVRKVIDNTTLPFIIRP